MKYTIQSNSQYIYDLHGFTTITVGDQLEFDPKKSIWIWIDLQIIASIAIISWFPLVSPCQWMVMPGAWHRGQRPSPGDDANVFAHGGLWIEELILDAYTCFIHYTYVCIIMDIH